jgi:hypothetical protein
VSDFTERELVARIAQRLSPAPDWLIVGIGDDAAVVEPERNRVEVFTVDALVEGVHFDRRFVPPDAIGHPRPRGQPQRSRRDGRGAAARAGVDGASRGPADRGL